MTLKTITHDEWTLLVDGATSSFQVVGPNDVFIVAAATTPATSVTHGFRYCYGKGELGKTTSFFGPGTKLYGRAVKPGEVSGVYSVAVTS